VRVLSDNLPCSARHASGLIKQSPSAILHLPSQDLILVAAALGLGEKGRQAGAREDVR
jgi:hypothetical protein